MALKHGDHNGEPFLVHNLGAFGISLSYDVFDFGKRRAAVRMECMKKMLEITPEVVPLRAEGGRIAESLHCRPELPEPEHEKSR